MKLRATAFVPLLLLFAFLCGSARGDTWGAPQKKKYFSNDKKYCLEVIPRDAKGNRPKAVFSELDGTTYVTKSEFPLVNKISPVNALVAADGKHVVTFDNWYQVGYGDDVVVIYLSDGTVVKKFSLADLFTKSDIEQFPHSVSSIWWGSGHYLDDKTGILHLKAGPKDAPREVTIELATGRRLEPSPPSFVPPSFVPQRHVTPQVEFDAVSTSAVEIVVAEPPAETTPGEPVCNIPEAKFETAYAMRISSQQLRAQATSLLRPGYPPLARARRIEGQIIVEVLVSKTGDVVCVRTLNGDPLLRAAVSPVAKKWKFKPFEARGEVSNVVSTLAVDFKLR